MPVKCWIDRYHQVNGAEKYGKQGGGGWHEVEQGYPGTTGPGKGLGEKSETFNRLSATSLLWPKKMILVAACGAVMEESLRGSREARQESSWREVSGLDQTIEKDRSGQIGDMLFWTEPAK